mmetsp:Transcript_131303/g.379864  ORF Transcript_131303/g.379864 Transcript_131303/m.379864 type:complete len:175 (+) Transcript_131303:96-620(+)
MRLVQAPIAQVLPVLLAGRGAMGARARGQRVVAQAFNSSSGLESAVDICEWGELLSGAIFDSTLTKLPSPGYCCEAALAGFRWSLSSDPSLQKFFDLARIEAEVAELKSQVDADLIRHVANQFGQLVASVEVALEAGKRRAALSAIMRLLSDVMLLTELAVTCGMADDIVAPIS